MHHSPQSASSTKLAQWQDGMRLKNQVLLQNCTAGNIPPLYKVYEAGNSGPVTKLCRRENHYHSTNCLRKLMQKAQQLAQ
eukprot:3859915-Rhodomonas_salina.1